MDKLLFKRILIGALTVLILVYVIYLFVSANFNMIETENAVKMTVTDKIYSQGFIVREEEYLKSSSNGYIAYELDDGDNVEANGIVAYIYPNSTDAVARQRIEAIDNQILSLNTLTKSYYSDSVDLDAVDSRLNNGIIDYLGNVNKGSLSTSLENLDSLLYTINQRQLITGQTQDFSAKIAELEAEKKSLEASSSKNIGTVKSTAAGYFVSVLDGYETAVDCKSINDITISDLDNLSKTEPPSDAVGKIVSNLNWYIVCRVSSNEALNLSFFENDDGVTVEMPFAATGSIPASIVAINQQDPDSDAAVVFKCNYMNSDLADARQESVEIGIEDYTGLRVSKQTLHDDFVTKYTEDENGEEKKETKKVQGVYILHGSELQFKEVSIIYSDSDYVICDPAPQDGVLFNGDTVQLYDKVVIKGDNLYDGKIVD